MRISKQIICFCFLPLHVNITMLCVGKIHANPNPMFFHVFPNHPKKNMFTWVNRFVFKLLLGYSRPRDVPSILFLQDGLPDASFVSCRMNQAFFTKFFRLHMASHKDHELLSLGKWWFFGHKTLQKMCTRLMMWNRCILYSIVYFVWILSSLRFTLLRLWIPKARLYLWMIFEYTK